MRALHHNYEPSRDQRGSGPTLAQKQESVWLRFCRRNMDLEFKEPGGRSPGSVTDAVRRGRLPHFPETRLLSVSVGMFLSSLTSSPDGCCQGVLIIYRQKHPEKYIRYWGGEDGINMEVERRQKEIMGTVSPNA